jgi:hypothetical protein
MMFFYSSRLQKLTAGVQIKIAINRSLFSDGFWSEKSVQYHQKNEFFAAQH